MSQMYPIWPQIFTGIITWGPFTTLSTRASHGNQMDFGIISGAKISSDIARIYYVSWALRDHESQNFEEIQTFLFSFPPTLALNVRQLVNNRLAGDLSLL